MIKKILWAEKMANEVKGSYEHSFSDDLKMNVRIYLPEGICYIDFMKMMRDIPKDFYWVGIYWCKIEKSMFMLVSQK